MRSPGLENMSDRTYTTSKGAKAKTAVSWLDLAAGGLALLILIGGLAMLFSGVAAFGEKDK
jgi:hypothetical protein